MDENLEFLPQIFFLNNGESDLLTGTLAPERFNQILARDMVLAQRSSALLSIIYARINYEKFRYERSTPKELKFDIKSSNSDIEAELVATAFLLKTIFRQSDCISRVYQIGFWISFVGSTQFDLEQVLLRAQKLCPIYLDLKISHRQINEDQLDWYQRIDELYI